MAHGECSGAACRSRCQLLCRHVKNVDAGPKCIYRPLFVTRNRAMLPASTAVVPHRILLVHRQHSLPASSAHSHPEAAPAQESRQAVPQHCLKQMHRFESHSMLLHLLHALDQHQRWHQHQQQLHLAVEDHSLPAVAQALLCYCLLLPTQELSLEKCWSLMLEPLAHATPR